jgi:hypothetical protein
MHVVGHQAIRVNRTTILPRKERQKTKINLPILVAEKALLAVVAPLPDMQRHLRDDNTRGSRHARSTSQDEAS